MAFGNIQVGTTFEATLRIHSTGTEALTVSGITGPSGYTASWTSGTIPAGSSHAVAIRFSPTEEKTYNGMLTVNCNHTTGTNTMTISGTGTRPPGPRTTFGAGKYLVGSDIASGRYFSDPADGCYWERLSGLGGSLDDIIANEFVGFNASQWVVDIWNSDKAFSTDSDCSTWFQSPRRGHEANISPGVWLVGSQVSPGLYRANVSSGCYWERMRDFTGTLDGIIDNDFIGSAGPQLVEIRSGDVGFYNDGDCGTWTPASSLAEGDVLRSSPHSHSEIMANRSNHRLANGLR